MTDREAIVLRNRCYINTAKPDVPEVGFHNDGAPIQGYKGASYMDSGYFYAPYLPLTKTPVVMDLKNPKVMDPEGYEPSEGILKRYGRKLLEEGKKFYGKIRLDELRD